MEATIIYVRESWPLQLVLETAEGRQDVALAENARITFGGDFVDPGALMPGQRVRILARSRNLQISELEILA